MEAFIKYVTTYDAVFFIMAGLFLSVLVLGILAQTIAIHNGTLPRYKAWIQDKRRFIHSLWFVAIGLAVYQSMAGLISFLVLFFIIGFVCGYVKMFVKSYKHHRGARKLNSDSTEQLKK